MTAAFVFHTSSELVEITGRRAWDLEHLLTLIREADGASIFHHTYQTMRQHHLLVERYPNDFAEWVHRACGEVDLAERLAGVDLREHGTLGSLRDRIVALVEAHLLQRPSARTRPARYPFDLCSAISVVTPTGDRAESLGELRGVLERCSIRTIHYHFVTARLRLDLGTNDLSAWLDTSLGLPDLAHRLDRIDLVTRTLEGIRAEILEVIA